MSAEAVATEKEQEQAGPLNGLGCQVPWRNGCAMQKHDENMRLFGIRLWIDADSLPAHHRCMAKMYRVRTKDLKSL